jgi:hypothetical protein
MSQVSLKDYPTPPFFYLLHVADNCPKALSTYIRLWADQSTQTHVCVSKKHTLEDYGLDDEEFRQDLLLLFSEGLVEDVSESQSKYIVELTPWEAMYDEFA